MALVVGERALPSMGRCMSAATSGMPLVSGPTADYVLSRSSDDLRLIVVDSANLMRVVEAIRHLPTARIIVLTTGIDESLLSLALQAPQILGFLAWRTTGIRPWELSYLIRSVVTPSEVPPSSADLLLWGASTVTWRPRSSSERDQVVDTVEMVARQFGVQTRLAQAAASAAHELLMNAMYDAPVDRSGKKKYAANRRANVHLVEHEIPTLQLTVDNTHLALDITDPFGMMERHHLFGGVIRGLMSTLDTSGGGAGLGLSNLFTAGSILRVEVIRGFTTQVSWVVDRTLSQRLKRSTPRSLYFVEGAPRATVLYQILDWARAEGGPDALSRIRIRTLPYALLEGINVTSVEINSTCSLELLDRIRRAASATVGQPCPH
ncbi:MAG TPA: hypothetical protein ENK18_24105 [Deltaproteobacteria bacterium]|nr:hypothetical protein [Deltaproteobacteria bacterium]